MDSAQPNRTQVEHLVEIPLELGLSVGFEYTPHKCHFGYHLPACSHLDDSLRASDAGQHGLYRLRSPMSGVRAEATLPTSYQIAVRRSCYSIVKL